MPSDISTNRESSTTKTATRQRAIKPAWESEGGLRPRRRGFTLVELMGVIVILGLLASIITVSVRRYMIQSRQNIARLEISKICQAVESFYVEAGRYPDSTEGLWVLLGTAEKPDGFLPGKRIADDPWGHPYDYVIPGADSPYEVISYGGDGREGGTGVDLDITSSDLDSVR